MKAFCIHLPNWGYAMTCYGSSKRDAVERFKQQQGLSRMPRGFAIWVA